MKKIIAATAAMVLASSFSVKSNPTDEPILPAGERIVSQCNLEGILGIDTLEHLKFLESEPEVSHDFGCKVVERRSYPSQKPHHVYFSIANKDLNHFHIYVLIGKNVVSELFESSSYLSTASASLTPGVLGEKTVQRRNSLGIAVMQISDFAKISQMPVADTYNIPLHAMVEPDEGGKIGPRYTTGILQNYRVVKLNIPK